MQFRYFSSSLIVIASLSACGGGGGGGGITNLPINNVDGVVLNASGGSLGIQTDGGLDLTLDTDADFDAGDFAGGSNLDAEGEGQILAVSEGDSTFSAFPAAMSGRSLTKRRTPPAAISTGRSA